MNLKEKRGELEEIAKQVVVCKNCSLCKQATRGVPGEGNPEAKIMFIGEAPGYNEDQQGRPFVGRAGQLLNQLLSEIGIKREEVFIANVVKHRPPENRDPLPEEITACDLFLDRQIETIDPVLIVTLGRFSLGKFLPGESISRVHGQARFVDFMGKRYVVLPMYHPAAALRSSQIADQLRQDFQKITRFIAGEFPLSEERGEESSNDPSQMSLL